MKRILLALAFLLLLAVPTAAQPSLCTITGTIYRPTGAACASCTFKITKSRKGGVVLSTSPVTVTADGSGAVSFTAVQGSIITLQGDVWLGTYSLSGGKDLYVPTESTGSLSALKSTEDALDQLVGSSTYAPASAGYITKTASSDLSNEFALGTLATGLLKNTTTTGVPTIAVAGTDYLPSIASLTADASPDGAADYVITYDASASAHKKVLLNNLPGGGGGAVSSVFGRTGAVTAASNDYTWAQIDKTTSSLADIATRSASDLSSGTLPDGRFPATLPAASGTNLTALNASALASGTVPLARLSGITTAELSATAGITNAQLAGSIAAAKLVGTDIATVGTITSGTWQGSVIGGAYGGAGTANGLLKANGSGTVSAATAGTDYVGAGAVTSSGLTMATARLLGRSTAGTGAVEEITVGSGLSLSAGTLSASGGGGSPGGSGSELQYRGGASTFSAVTGSSVSGANIALAPDATTGNGFSVAGSTISSGNLVSISATGTAAASNSKHALLVATSGANATSSQTTYGAEITNTSTGTSSTNIALQLTASGGTTNTALNVTAGQIAVPSGSSGNPSIIFGGTQVGFYAPIAGEVYYASNTGGTGALIGFPRHSDNFFRFRNTTSLSWTSGVPDATSDDLILRRAAAANLAVEGASTTAGAISSPARTPSQITSNQDNWAPGVGMFMRVSSDASRNVTGRSAGQAGEFSYVWNVGSNDIVLVHESASSTAANRFTNSGGADITLAAGRCALMQYDTTSSRWRVVLLFLFALRIRIRRRVDRRRQQSRRRVVIQ